MGTRSAWSTRAVPVPLVPKTKDLSLLWLVQSLEETRQGASAIARFDLEP